MYLTIADINAGNERDWDTVHGKIRLRKLSAGEMLAYRAEQDKDPDTAVARAVALSLVEPKVSIDDVIKLPFDFCETVMKTVAEFNGLASDKKK